MDDLSQVLHDVCFVRFGSALSPDTKPNLLRELVSHQRSLRRSGRDTISEQAIRAWMPKDGEVRGPRRASALVFLGEYLDWIKSRRLIKDGEQMARYRTLTVSLRLHRTSIDDAPAERDRSGLERALQNVRLTSPDPYILLTLQVLASVTSGNRHKDFIDLPRRSKTGAAGGEAYYLSYRYAPTGDSIIKSFIALKTPLPGIESFASFSHFMWLDDPSGKQVHRECEGVLLKFASTCYLLGYNYDVRENKKIFPREYQAKRIGAKLNPLGIEAISIRYETIDKRNGLYDGVSMTVSAEDRPAVSRVALLLIGTMEDIGFKLNDSIVEPCGLAVGRDRKPADVIASDLRAVLERVKSLGPGQLPDRFRRPGGSGPTKRSWESTTGRDIARLIDNAAVSTAAGKDPIGQGGVGHGGSMRPPRGAIEAVD